MKVSTFYLAAALVCSALSAAVPVVDGTPALPEGSGHHLDARGEQYNVNTFDELEAESASADEEQLEASVNYLAKVWSANGATWAVMGGLAMQKYGMARRTTEDTDIAVSILPAAITRAVAADPNIHYPPPLMASSGVVSLFVNTNGQLVKNDIFASNSEMAPSLENTVTIDGWPIVSLFSLVKSKVRRAWEKDIEDVAWLCENKSNEVTAFASRIDYQSRLSFASDTKEANSDKLNVICRGLQLDPSRVPSK